MAYTSQYPTQDDDHVKATSQNDPDNFHPHFATDPTKSVIGIWSGNGWASAADTNQRFHIDLGSAKIIRNVYYENGHYSGLYTGYGVRNFTLWGSNSADAFADLVYSHDTDWTQLTTEISAFVEHVAANQADPHYFTVTNTTTYRYYAFKFADQYGLAGGTMVIRRVELQTEDGYSPGSASLSVSATPSVSISATPSVSISASPSISVSATKSASPSISESASPSISQSVSESATPSSTPSVSVSATPSISKSASPSISVSATPSATPSVSESATKSASPSVSVSATKSASPSVSVSATPSVSISLSKSASPSISESATKSASPSVSVSATKSASPSVSESATLSASPSISESATKSASPSISVSATKSASPSISLSASPSISESASISLSPSPSPSSGYTGYTRGDEVALPVNDADLETTYTPQNVTDVATKDNVRVAQTATQQYMLHQYKNFVGSQTFCQLEWEGQTTLAPSSSTVYLQIYNRNTSAWVTVDSDASSAPDTDFTLIGYIADLTDYKDDRNVISSRVYQEAL